MPHSFPTRRSSDLSYILNLTPEATFENVVTKPKNKIWASWREKASSGDAFADRRVGDYQTRPAEELYDMASDPFQLNNLAADPTCGGELQKLRELLRKWMARQGDLGQPTELAALEHQWKGAKEE
jgi:uncharacterized sulfatase